MPHRDRPESLAMHNASACPSGATGEPGECPHWDYEDEYPHLTDEQVKAQRERIRRWKRDRAEGRA